MPGGRPPAFDNPEDMQPAIEEYFLTCGDKPLCFTNANSGETEYVRDKNGSAIIKSIPPTMNGLAYALGFTSRQSLADYEKKDEFAYLVKRAKLRIKQYWETRLDGPSPAGAIFWMKNHDGLVDKLEHEMTGAMSFSFGPEAEGV